MNFLRILIILAASYVAGLAFGQDYGWCPSGTCSSCANGNCGQVYQQPIYSQPAYQQAPQQSVYQQENVLQTSWQDPRMVLVQGSGGTLATGWFVSADGYNGYIGTATHHLKEVGESVTVSTGDGKKHPGKVVAFDKEADAAFVQLDNGVQGKTAFELASQETEVGQNVFFSGFGMGTLRTQQMVVQRVESDYVYASGKPIQGDSGGPVVDRYGRVVGCISGQPGGPAIFPRLARLRLLLANLLGRNRLVPVQPIPGPVSPNVSPKPSDPGIPAFDLAGRVKSLEDEVSGLRDEKQDKGDYVLKSDLIQYAKAGEVDGVVTSVETLSKAVKDRPTVEQVQQAVQDEKPGLLAQIKKDVAETNGRIKTEAVDEVKGLIGRNKDLAVSAAKTAALGAAKTAVLSQLPKLGLLALIPGVGGLAAGATALTWAWRLHKKIHGSEVPVSKPFRG